MLEGIPDHPVFQVGLNQFQPHFLGYFSLRQLAAGCTVVPVSVLLCSCPVPIVAEAGTSPPPGWCAQCCSLPLVDQGRGTWVGLLGALTVG